MFMFQAEKKSSKSYLVNVALKTSARWSSRWSQSWLLSEDMGTYHLGSMNVCTRFHGDFEIFWSGPNWWGHPTESRTGLLAQPECITGILGFSPMLHSQPSHYAGPVFSSRSSQIWTVLTWHCGWRLRLFLSLDHPLCFSTPTLLPPPLSSSLPPWLKTVCLEDERASERLHVAGWNMWQRFHTQDKASGDCSPLIIHSVQGGVNGRPESDTAEIQNPFQQFLNEDDLSWNKRPLWARRMGDIVDPKVRAAVRLPLSNWLNTGPNRRGQPGLNCSSGGSPLVKL